MPPEELYRTRLIQALLEVGGLKRGLHGVPPRLRRQAARNLIAQYGQELADLGMMGHSKRLLDRATARFVDRVYSVLTAQSSVNAASATRQLRQAIDAWHRDVLRSALITQGRIMVAIEAAHRTGLQAYGAAAGITFDISVFDDFSENVSRKIATGRPGAVHTTQALIDNAFSNTSKAVDKWIMNMDGRPARDVAAEFFQQLIGDKHMRGAAESLGHRGQQIRRGVQRVGVIKQDMAIGRKGKGIYANLNRIMKSEEQAIKHQASLYGAAKSPAIQFVHWKTSNVHDRLPSSPDICDVYEDWNAFGAGPGLWRPETCPGHPHPFCQCTVEGVVIPPDNLGPIGEPPKTRRPSSRAVQRILRQHEHDGSPALTERRLATTTDWADRDIDYGEYRYSRFGV